MNERNVAALTASIARVLASPEGWRAMAEPRAMAEQVVADCGALVPSTLTDGAGFPLTGEMFPRSAAELERIAKGEP